MTSPHTDLNHVKTMSYTNSDYIACMFHIDALHFDYIEQTLKEYDIGHYLIGHEIEPYHHFHILFQGTDKIYTLFSKRIIEKFNLRGQAKSGKTRQYGKLKLIENIDKLMAYTVKDGNVRSNLPADTLAIIKEQSFKKDETKRLINKVIDELPKSQIYNDNDTLRNYIIGSLLRNTKPDFYFTRSMVEKILFLYLRQQDSNTKTTTIFNYLYSY